MGLGKVANKHYYAAGVCLLAFSGLACYYFKVSKVAKVALKGMSEHELSPKAEQKVYIINFIPAAIAKEPVETKEENEDFLDAAAYYEREETISREIDLYSSAIENMQQNLTELEELIHSFDSWEDDQESKDLDFSIESPEEKGYGLSLGQSSSIKKVIDSYQFSQQNRGIDPEHSS